MSEPSTQDVTVATDLHGTAESSTDATTPLASASFRFQELPLDVVRMIYDWLPEPELQPLLKTHDGLTLYAEVWSVPQGILLTNKFFRNDIMVHVEEYIAKQPIVIYWHTKPRSDSNIDYTVAVLFDLFHHGQLYDARNTNKLPGMSRASFDKWTLKAPMMHFMRKIKDRKTACQNDLSRYLQPYGNKMFIEWRLDEATLEIFYRQSLAKLRRQPKPTIEVCGLAQDASQIHVDFTLSEARDYLRDLPIKYTLVALTGLATDGETKADSQVKRRLANKSERELLDQLSS